MNRQTDTDARVERLSGLLQESWHFVKAIEEYEGERHTLRWEQALDLRKRIDASLARPPSIISAIDLPPTPPEVAAELRRIFDQAQAYDPKAVIGGRRAKSVPRGMDAVRVRLMMELAWAKHADLPVSEVCQRIMDRFVNPPKHRFWGSGEADCPADIKASIGELHTLRCKVCGEDAGSDNRCFGPQEAAAQGMETGTAKTEGLGAKPDSPVGNADAPKETQHD